MYVRSELPDSIAREFLTEDDLHLDRADRLECGEECIESAHVNENHVEPISVDARRSIAMEHAPTRTVAVRLGPHRGQVVARAMHLKKRVHGIPEDGTVHVERITAKNARLFEPIDAIPDSLSAQMHAFADFTHGHAGVFDQRFNDSSIDPIDLSLALVQSRNTPFRSLLEKFKFVGLISWNRLFRDAALVRTLFPQVEPFSFSSELAPRLTHPGKIMKIQQIRNAALRITFGGKHFLIDPWLAPKGAMAPLHDERYRFLSEEKAKLPMPLCDLPMPLEAVLDGIDAYIVTHVHPDHIDMAADGTVGAPLCKDTPVFVQNEEDAECFRRSGFKTVTVLGETTLFEGVTLRKTPGRHGTKIPCGPACGVVFAHPLEKKLYLAGDTIWYDAVETTIRRETPDVIVLNACAAELVDQGRLIMDDADVSAVCRTAPDAAVIVSHMDTVSHAEITRPEMRERLAARGLLDRVEIPEDGETLAF